MNRPRGGARRAAAIAATRGTVGVRAPRLPPRQRAVDRRRDHRHRRLGSSGIGPRASISRTRVRTSRLSTGWRPPTRSSPRTPRRAPGYRHDVWWARGRPLRVHRFHRRARVLNAFGAGLDLDTLYGRADSYAASLAALDLTVHSRLTCATMPGARSRGRRPCPTGRAGRRTRTCRLDTAGCVRPSSTCRAWRGSSTSRRSPPVRPRSGRPAGDRDRSGDRPRSGLGPPISSSVPSMMPTGWAGGVLVPRQRTSSVAAGKPRMSSPFTFEPNATTPSSVAPMPAGCANCSKDPSSRLSSVQCSPSVDVQRIMSSRLSAAPGTWVRYPTVIQPARRVDDAREPAEHAGRGARCLDHTRPAPTVGTPPDRGDRASVADDDVTAVVTCDRGNVAVGPGDRVGRAADDRAARPVFDRDETRRAVGRVDPAARDWARRRHELERRAVG